MRTFSETKNGLVLRVIVIEPEILATGKWGDPLIWVETHEDKSARKHYSGIGYTYDKTRDAFIEPQPPAAIGFDEAKCEWIVPPSDHPLTPIP